MVRLGYLAPGGQNLALNVSRQLSQFVGSERMSVLGKTY